MLDDLTARHSKKIVVCRRRFGARFDEGKNEIAFRNVPARYQHFGSAGLHHPGHPRFHLSASVTHFGRMLKVMISLDEFIGTIETQFNGHDLLEVANESSIRFRPFAINNNSRTIHLCMPGRIGSGLGGLSAPMFDDVSALETKKVKRYDRPRKAGPTFVFRM